MTAIQPQTILIIDETPTKTSSCHTHTRKINVSHCTAFSKWHSISGQTTEVCATFIFEFLQETTTLRSLSIHETQNHSFYEQVNAAILHPQLKHLHI
jgi:hypothetical protein